MTDDGAQPLAGRVVGVTAERRKEELTALLSRAGATVLEAPAMRLVPIEDDTDARSGTERCLERPVDYAVAMTGVGFRGWLAAADAWGIGEELRASLSASTILARGPKARGAIRGAGLAESWHATTEASAEVLSHLLEMPLAGKRVVVQLHGERLPQFVEPLRAAGAEVIDVPLYRWEPPADIAPVEQLVARIAARTLDAIAVTSGPQAVVLFDVAARMGRRDEVIAALSDRSVLPAVIGPVCARPFDELGIAPVWPERFRLGDLARLVVDRLS